MSWAACRICIRPARAKDGASLVAIDDLTWTAAVSPAPPPERPRDFFGWRQLPEDVLGADLDGAAVGYAVLHNAIPLPSHQPVLELNGLAGHPDAAGWAVCWWRPPSRRPPPAAPARSRCGCWAPTPRPRRLYARCGFVEEGVLREEFLLDGRYVDDVLMARRPE